jgi:phospholipid transport system substrate-binding protein
MTRASLLIPALLAAGVPALVQAQAADPAAAQIDAFDAVLLKVMKQGKALGPQGRYKELQPAVERAFDLPAMARFAVGPKWAGAAPQEQVALVAAFTRLTIASYAHNFDSYDGERFVLDPSVETRGPDKLVKTQVVPTHGDPTHIAYRMRQVGGTWKIIDVYYKGAISELATRRSDFSSAPTVQALIQRINALADKQMG